ncbi:hypothetical protein BH23ACT4_BH23ACT4_11880 [soil metagenome]
MALGFTSDRVEVAGVVLTHVLCQWLITTLYDHSLAAGPQVNLSAPSFSNSFRRAARYDDIERRTSPFIAEGDIPDRCFFATDGDYRRWLEEVGIPSKFSNYA